MRFTDYLILVIGLLVGYAATMSDIGLLVLMLLSGVLVAAIVLALLAALDKYLEGKNLW